jgi:hypothetical protein
VQVGGLGDANYALEAVPTNANALDGLSTTPFVVDDVVMDAPGGMGGVSGANVIATAPGSQMPVAAAWNEDQLVGGLGHVAVVMNVNLVATAPPADTSQSGPGSSTTSAAR